MKNPDSYTHSRGKNTEIAFLLPDAKHSVYIYKIGTLFFNTLRENTVAFKMESSEIEINISDTWFKTTY